MAKSARPREAAPQLFEPVRRKHPRLFLAKLLEEKAYQAPYDDDAGYALAVERLAAWAVLGEQGHLNQKETALDDQFLSTIFGQAFGYKSLVENPADYHREKQFSVPGGTFADGALGRFKSGETLKPYAVIELKGAAIDLDHDKSNGRTAVDQLWGYLNEMPDCKWGILSNYATLRLYHRDSRKSAYEEFTLADFKNPSRVRQLYYLLRRDNLLPPTRLKGTPLTLELLSRTSHQQREVGDKLYKYYSEQRGELIAALMHEKKLPQDQAIHAAQRLLDRIIFMAFCEDRHLLPEKLIRRTFENVPPLARATNPRWQAFLDAFQAIDQGHPALDLKTGYNGELFKPDAVIDHLDLDDRWTEIFRQIGEYDFREEGEISVDVLGHLFERSITELEKLRVVGLFGSQAADGSAAMPKSAERKRFGIYYTPPAFTQLIVDQTLGKLIEERVDPLADPLAKVEALRRLKVCDPACGSGAFLIAAYDRFDQAYEEAAVQIDRTGQRLQAEELRRVYPDYILSDNLYGVDLSAESVEITKLALWIRSARRGRSLLNLSEHIAQGNSLVRDPAVHPKAFVWQDLFPDVFAREESGFDCVIGNPPWERMKLQEREFFALAAPEIAGAVNAATRRKLIESLETAHPELHGRYTAKKADAEQTLAYVRSEAAGFPLTGRGDVNTYMLFAELARTLVAPHGRVGLLVPSGIATDNTTKDFFGELMSSHRLVRLFDFENKKPWFEDVHRSFKFTVLVIAGRAVRIEEVDFAFFLNELEDLQKPDRHIPLSVKDLKLLNPNTKTCPIFRSRRDAALTKGVYGRVPILVDDNRRQGGNPWGVKFVRMFDQTNDAEHFVEAETLQADGYELIGNRWQKGKATYLPFYEAKMIQAFDHRASSVVIEKANWFRQGQKEETSNVEHQNPEFVVQPRWWEKSVRSSKERRAS